ncbi:MAG: hypothetical protein VB957_11390 [Pseudomonadales bacterium]
MCVASGGLKGSDQMHFRELCWLLQSVFHFEFHEKLESLKDSYAPLNPDRDTRKIGVFTDDGNKDFVSGLNELLNKANYKRLSDEELEQAMEEASLFKLKLHINLAEFDEVLIYCRGESSRQEVVTSFYGLRKKTITFSHIDRVVIYFLLSEPELTTVELMDSRIESWFSERWESEVDFDEMVAMSKLQALGLVRIVDGKLQAVSIDEACLLLDKRWDDYFSYNDQRSHY